MKHLDWLHLIASIVASVFVHPRLWRQFLESGLMPFKIFNSTGTEDDNNWSDNVLPWLFSPRSRQNGAALRKKPSLDTWDLCKKCIVWAKLNEDLLKSHLFQGNLVPNQFCPLQPQCKPYLWTSKIKRFKVDKPVPLILIQVDNVQPYLSVKPVQV